MSATAAMPISACGTSSAGELKPNSFTDATCTHSASGGLSTVITPDVSNAPYRNACQLVVIERTAAL